MSTAATVGLGVVALCALFVIAAAMRAMPRTTFTIWSVVLFFVPVWIGQFVGSHLFFSAITVVTLLAVAALGRYIQPCIADAFMVMLLVVVFFEFGLGLVGISNAIPIVTEWLLFYIWGRLILSVVDPRYICGCLAICAMVAAALAVIESMTDTNFFMLMRSSNSLYSTWGSLQMRGGDLRAEGAWGHSISLGAALAMSSPFILSAPWKPVLRILGLLLIATGTVVTLSRIGMIALVLAVVLSVALLPAISRMTRIAVVILGCAAAVAMAPFVSTIFAEDDGEAATSATYRGDLFSLFRFVRLFGSARSFEGVTVAGHYLGNFASSTDNAILLTGLRLGWVALVIVCVVLILAGTPVFMRNRVNPATISVVAVIPSLFTVALITQFGMFFWFMIGLSVAWSRFARSRDTPADAALRASFDDDTGAIPVGQGSARTLTRNSSLPRQ
ncbi:O-antigen ligase family protein [Acidipropionibacterium thoenii]|uniref:O-antigen ligase family protein n=1 Tax=Acidipropionibacterium thoenii TaxID=1751 RepID=UPI00041B621B|nr:O-antigen ligase family protein [Acidipropionibacterium thoenii]